jgi:amidase
LSRDHHTFTFAVDNTPALEVAVIHVQTWDCYKGTVQEDENALDEPDLSLANPVTGPIYVTGAQPGDMLALRL